MKRSNRNTNESAVFAVASTDRTVDPLDGQMDFEAGEEFNGWFMAPMDGKVQQDEKADPPFEVDFISITKVCIILISFRHFKPNSCTLLIMLCK